MSGPHRPTHYLTDATGRRVRDLTERESAAYVERLANDGCAGCSIPSLLHDKWRRARRELHRLTTWEERRELHRWLELHEGRVKAHTWETIAERDTRLRERGGAA